MDMEKDEMLPAKEWAKRAGLKLYNFDGFKDIYEKLSGNESNNMYDYISIRFRDAGELLCTRRGFESRLFECTMEFPEISQYEHISEVLPDYIESQIRSRISAICGAIEQNTGNQEQLRYNVELLLELMRLKLIARSRSIELNGGEKVEITPEIDLRDFSEKEKEIIIRHKGTVEDLEEELYKEITDKLKEILNDEEIDKKKIPFESIGIYKRLFYKTGRRQRDRSEEEEFMYLNIPGQEKEELDVPFSIISRDGIQKGVAIDKKTEGNGRITGAITIPQVKRSEVSEELDKSEEEKTEEALQTIDSQVSPEQRKGLFAKIKEFAKKIFKSKDNNHEGR